MKKLAHLFRRLRKRSESVRVEEPFVTLIQVAQEDSEIKNTLLTILKKEDFHRTSMLHTLIDEMRFKGAPVDLIEAITCLLDPQVADRVYHLLNRELEY